MPAQQGDVELLSDPVAQALLASRHPAHLAYTWTDGTPRVVPIWFAWTGETIVFGTPPKAPKLRALQHRQDVAVTVDVLDDVVPEYAQAAERYFGPEQGAAWLSQLRGQPMARVSVRPSWVTVLDFETRFPSAISA